MRENTAGVSIVLGCETDFVGKNESFVKLGDRFGEEALIPTKEEFLASDFGGMTVAEKLIEQTGVIGEKIDINDFTKVEAPYVGSYIHVGNKIASLVGLSANVRRS